MRPEDQAITLLRAEQRGVEISMEMLGQVFRSARPIHTTDTRPPLLADDAMTKLDDYRASIEREIKQLLRKREGANR